MKGKIIEEITTTQTMNRVSTPYMPFDWSINPYRGCTHGCSFCYARPTHSYLGMNADDTFQNHILLKANAAEALERQLARMPKRHHHNLQRLAADVGLVTIGTATDPYQPLEAKAKITRECLKVLAKYQVVTAITTRSPLILRDLDILKEMNIAAINVSVNTVNKKVWRNIEPATPAPEKRLEAVSRLVDNGLYTGIFIAPILPFLTDSIDEMERVAKAAKEHQAAFATASILRLKPEVKAWYFGTIQTHYPNLVQQYKALYKATYAPASYVEPTLKRAYQAIQKHSLSPDIRDWHDAIPYVLQGSEKTAEQLSFTF